MTREEYIKFANALKNNYTIDFDKLPEFCDMAISALSESEEDLISRKSLLNKINAYVVGSQDKEFICKLIIDIPKELYHGIECRNPELETEYVCYELMKAVDNGTLLDDVKAEIEQIYQDIDTCSHNEYENAVEQGKEIAYENVLEILDNIGKAESEE